MGTRSGWGTIYLFMWWSLIEASQIILILAPLFKKVLDLLRNHEFDGQLYDISEKNVVAMNHFSLPAHRYVQDP